MTEIKTVRCPICDHVGEWTNVDRFRFTPKGMHICDHCGFVHYPEKYQTEDEIKAHYKADYRQPPSIGNAFTGQKKLHIHSAFLTDTLREWQKAGITKPVICDVGAAFGMFLNWIRQHFPEAELHGTEYTLSYRRNAWWEYGIRLDLDFDQSLKYDLISSFKVAEHQLDVDKRLREYALALKDGGLLYVSVPTWFSRMSNFGADGFDLEYYYAPDHINAWTREHFEYLLQKCGLEVLKHDEWLYDSTYLCKRNDALMESAQCPLMKDHVLMKMDVIKEAFVLYGAGDFEGALRKYKNFPIAWINLYESIRSKAHKNNEGQPPIEYIEKTVLAPAEESCPYSLEIIRLKADVYMRYDQFQKAVEVLQDGLQKRPNNAAFLSALTHCFREIALRTPDPKDRLRMFKEARDCGRYLREVDLQLRNDAVNWIYRDNSELPMPFEGERKEGSNALGSVVP